ncbi:hypothetical protein AVEN_81858-1 [Araneus ventricosus]|uniref:Uncharacterized protein n=1 Tax=Araneus ventricosus TaxID=182803 RepID=A0A4Y2SVZ0_ARAVE|nr:hypothetical protein AVEN_81858-1 [Araneus ventricosus]
MLFSLIWPMYSSSGRCKPRKISELRFYGSSKWFSTTGTLDFCEFCSRQDSGFDTAESAEEIVPYVISQIAEKACLKGFGNLVVGKGKGLLQRFP